MSGCIYDTEGVYDPQKGLREKKKPWILKKYCRGAGSWSPLQYY